MYVRTFFLCSCVPCDEQALLLARFETSAGLCHAKLATRARLGLAPAMSPASIVHSQSSPCASVSSVATVSLGREVRLAKVFFRRSLLHALPNRFKKDDALLSVSSPTCTPIDADDDEVPLWFSGALLPASLAEPWLPSTRLAAADTVPTTQPDLYVDTVPTTQPDLYVRQISLQTAFEAHRALRNAAAVELELKPDAQHIDEALAFVEAARMIAEAQIKHAAPDEPAVLAQVHAEFHSGLTLCQKLAARLLRPVTT